VAVVNEDVILRSELDRSIANITAQFAAQQGGQLPPRDVLEKPGARAPDPDAPAGRAAPTIPASASPTRELQQAVAQIASQNKMTVEQLRAR
jgi:peptidyl-prolyl cis-trans isomerase SurA